MPMPQQPQHQVKIRSSRSSSEAEAMFCLVSAASYMLCTGVEEANGYDGTIPDDTGPFFFLDYGFLMWLGTHCQRTHIGFGHPREFEDPNLLAATEDANMIVALWQYWTSVAQVVQCRNSVLATSSDDDDDDDEGAEQQLAPTTPKEPFERACREVAQMMNTKLMVQPPTRRFLETVRRCIPGFSMGYNDPTDVSAANTNDAVANNDPAMNVDMGFFFCVWGITMQLLKGQRHPAPYLLDRSETTLMDYAAARIPRKWL